MMRSWLPAAAFAAVLAPGIVHALYTGRLTVSNEPTASALRLSRLSLDLDGWDTSPVKIDPRQISQAEVDGYLSQVYRQRGGDAKIGVFVACGRPGPISVHTPEICYAGAGYKMLGEKSSVTLKCAGSTADFFSATFVKPSATGEQKLKIYWSWKADGAWQARSRPRWAFGGLPVLHKLSVIQSLSGAEKISDASCLEFIKSLVTTLDTELFDPRRTNPL